MRFNESIWWARIPIIAGFALGWGSLSATVRHLGNENFLLVPSAPLAQTHSWHHFLRELGGDFGCMAAVLIIIFAAPRYRTPVTWWVMLILLLGFYAPFWIGTPFDPAYGAPSMQAEINHLVMTIPTMIGCFLAWPHFRPRGLGDQLRT